MLGSEVFLLLCGTHQLSVPAIAVVINYSAVHISCPVPTFSASAEMYIQYVLHIGKQELRLWRLGS